MGGVADAQAAEEDGEITAELGAVVRLYAAQGEGDGLEEAGQGPADSGGGASLQDSGSQEAAAVVDQGELEASLREVLEVHLGPLSWILLGVAGPDGLGFAWSAHQRPAAAEHPVHAAQAATDEASLPQIGIEAAHSPAHVPGELPG